MFFSTLIDDFAFVEDLPDECAVRNLIELVRCIDQHFNGSVWDERMDSFVCFVSVKKTFFGIGNDDQIQIASLRLTSFGYGAEDNRLLCVGLCEKRAKKMRNFSEFGMYSS